MLHNRQIKQNAHITEVHSQSKVHAFVELAQQTIISNRGSGIKVYSSQESQYAWWYLLMVNEHTCTTMLDSLPGF